MPGRDGNGPIRQGSENVWKGKGMGYGRGFCNMSAEFLDIGCLERKKRHLERQPEAVIMQLDANNEKAYVVQKSNRSGDVPQVKTA